MYILLWKFMDLSLSKNFFDLDKYFSKKESFESFKKRSWTRNFDHCGPRLDFFLAEVSKYETSHWIFLLPIRIKFSSRESSIHSIITVIHFSRAIKVYKHFYKIISRKYEPQALICRLQLLFWFHLTTSWIKLSCNRGIDHTWLFWALLSQNWNAKFRSTKKRLKGKRKRQKKLNYTLINLCHSIKCIHRLRCLHFEKTCSLLIAECRFW